MTEEEHKKNNRPGQEPRRKNVYAKSPMERLRDRGKDRGDICRVFNRHAGGRVRVNRRRCPIIAGTSSPAEARRSSRTLRPARGLVSRLDDGVRKTEPVVLGVREHGLDRDGEGRVREGAQRHAKTIRHPARLPKDI